MSATGDTSGVAGSSSTTTTSNGLSAYTTTLGVLIFCISYVFIAFKLPFIPIGRVCGTLCCAVLAVIFQILPPEAALAAINLDTVALLFGTMVMTILLDREGFFDVAQRVLTYQCRSYIGLLARVCTVSGVLAALITNDTVCVFLTPVVLQLCERYDLPHGPYLLALATSSNIGSACSPVGNPQNMIIASLSGLKFGQFITANILAVVVSMCINIALLIALYYRVLWKKTFIPTNAKFIRAPESDEYLAQHSGAKQDTQQSIAGQSFIDGASPSDQVELSDVTVTPNNGVNADTHQQNSYDGLHMNAEVDERMKDLRMVDASAPKHVDGTASPVCDCDSQPNTLRHRNVSKPRNTNGTILHHDNDGTKAALASDMPDEPLKASAILKLPVREASFEHPRQLKRRLVMVASCVTFEMTESGYNAPAQRTALQTLIYYCRHPNKLWIFALTLVGVIAAFGAGSPLEWASVGGATFMLLADWCEPEPTLQKVDWSLLVFFSALFMVVQALNNTGIPTLVIDALIPYMDIATVTGMLVYMSIILLGSNTVSNVPLVLVLGPFIPTFTVVNGSWLLLAYVSTVAGNLTLVGSVANLIVAQRAKGTYYLSFTEYLRFGFLSTLLYTTVGSFLVWLLVK